MGETPSIANAVAIVLAVNWPPHAPSPGHAAHSTACSSLSSIFPALRAPAMIRVARRQLDPAVRDADKRPREVFVGEADGAKVRARGRAVGAVQQRATLVAGIERHGCPPVRCECTLTPAAWRRGT